jgi:predicted nucleic acid-binding protein
MLSLPTLPVVVDASVAVDVLLDADPPLSDRWEAWLEGHRSVLTPAYFWPEVANALLRGRRLAVADVDALLTLLSTAGIEVADRGPRGIRGSLPLAERHGLTVYDAAYLWLAIDIDAELATKDRALIRAAKAEDVPLAV